MLADQVDYVVGVDTHRDEHVLAVVVAPSGAVVAQRSVRASARGYAQALRFIEQYSSGRRVWAVEGVGHYGAGLARYLSGRGETVLEIGRGPRDEQRLQGKDDQLDAIRAARTALASRKLTLPRAGERREALRLLLLARRSAVNVRREALVQLRSVIVTCPDRLREQLRRLPAGRLVVRCSRFRRSSAGTPDELASRLVLRSLARRVEAATAEAAELEREIHAHVRVLAPQLLDEPGIGPIVAAQLIVTWSHPGRVRSEAAFARLAGVAPIPPPQGKRPGTGSAAAATDNSTVRCTPSSSTAANTTKKPRTTSHAASPKAKQPATPSAHSSATSPATSTGYCKTRNR